MNWLTAFPWKWAGVAAVVGAALLFYRHQIAEAEDRGYEKAIAENQIALNAAQEFIIAAERRAREVEENARAQVLAETAANAAEFAARQPSIIRVCIEPPRSPGAMPRAGDDPAGAASGTPATGILPEEARGNTESLLDVAPLRELMRECDDLVAKYRGVLALEM